MFLDLSVILFTGGSLSFTMPWYRQNTSLRSHTPLPPKGRVPPPPPPPPKGRLPRQTQTRQNPLDPSKGNPVPYRVNRRAIRMLLEWIHVEDGQRKFFIVTEEKMHQNGHPTKCISFYFDWHWWVTVNDRVTMVMQSQYVYLVIHMTV